MKDLKKVIVIDEAPRICSGRNYDKEALDNLEEHKMLVTAKQEILEGAINSFIVELENRFYICRLNDNKCKKFGKVSFKDRLHDHILECHSFHLINKAINLALKKGAEEERKKCREEYAKCRRIDISCDECKKEKSWYNYCPKCRLKIIKNQFNFGFSEGEKAFISKIDKQIKEIINHRQHCMVWKKYRNFPRPKATSLILMECNKCKVGLVSELEKLKKRKKQ